MRDRCGGHLSKRGKRLHRAQAGRGRRQPDHGRRLYPVCRAGRVYDRQRQLDDAPGTRPAVQGRLCRAHHAGDGGRDLCLPRRTRRARHRPGDGVADGVALRCGHAQRARIRAGKALHDQGHQSLQGQGNVGKFPPSGRYAPPDRVSGIGEHPPGHCPANVPVLWGQCAPACAGQPLHTRFGRHRRLVSGGGHIGARPRL